jgi:hypothetical protein
MSEVYTVAKYWAVLIGINFYAEKPLKGCVRDVENVKQYLKAGSTPVTVVALTASTPPDQDPHHPPEQPNLWPTYENVISNLTNLTKEAKPGDSVYIHYCGHGTRILANSSEYNNKGTGDLALVLFDDVNGSRYLRGQELASQLNKMVKNGLWVTLVLDCCFSGSVVRHSNLNGGGIRAIDYDPAIDAAYPSTLSTGIEDQINNSSLRDARILPKWLIDPNGYTIFTACGPHEIARELEFEGGGRNGALSYFLLRALTSLKTKGVEITHQSLYQHLRIRFHAEWPQQNPMRYGNKNRSFFGELRLGPDMAFISVFRIPRDGPVYLGAGYAHGVHEGDEYALYPLNKPENVSNDAEQDSTRAKVSAVRGLTSDLVQLDPISAMSRVKTGWKAKPLTHLSPQKLPVQLKPSLGDPSQWITAAKQRRFLHISAEEVEGQPFLFSVERNERSEYEILDGLRQKVTSLPAIPSDRDGALDSVLDLLQHLAAFKYIEGIENRIPTASFTNSFEINLSDRNGKDLEAGDILNVSHEDELSLTVQNFGDKPLYVAIFDLGPSWQIASLTCEDGGGEYMVVPSKNDRGDAGKIEVEWEMIVPDSFRKRGQEQCEDVIKVFVTSKPTSFAPLVLPKIPISAENVDRSVRGVHNQLSEFLSGLATPLRGTKDDSLDEQWVTWNFIIRTSSLDQ